MKLLIPLDAELPLAAFGVSQAPLGSSGVGGNARRRDGKGFPVPPEVSSSGSSHLG